MQRENVLDIIWQHHNCFSSGLSAQWWLHGLHHAIEKKSA